ncbi:unnamed protein product [Rotaria magnacalcarata]|nr:unnamed protein product [Rotaria magnacalcarata]
MLRTSLFNQSKTGENTRKNFFPLLSSYDIDPNHFHVVYISDNGSNLVYGLQGEVHLRYICLCLNLALHNGVDMCPIASEQLSADTTLTLHLVVPWFTKLKASCEPTDDEPILLIQFKNAVSKMLDEKIYLTSLH